MFFGLNVTQLQFDVELFNLFIKSDGNNIIAAA